ncbi:hypothetical protein TNCV_1629131 [Trichonephila clavipes]|uniref:Uncharacterized protein n=1 Tax=Trichonephila clavipes TaxID=2585209 RepID=A0A8X6W9Z5_TRICX|nr:hypothetical protein TNCV_1629131 [Trichonephila clavipes]
MYECSGLNWATNFLPAKVISRRIKCVPYHANYTCLIPYRKLYQIEQSPVDMFINKLESQATTIKNCVVIDNAPDRKCQIEAHKVHRGKGLVFTPVVIRSFERHVGGSNIWLGSTAILQENTLGVGALPPTSLENFRLDEYLERLQIEHA